MTKRLALLFFLLASTAASQGVRFSSTVTQQGTIGTATNAVVLPSGATIAFCNHPANAVPCTNKATTYTDQTLTSSCLTSTQLVLDGTSTCVALPDAQNNWGVWVAPNSAGYDYTIALPGGVNRGPFNVLSQNTIGSLTGGSCSASSISSLLALTASGGTLDERACTTAFTWSSTVTITQPVTLWLPCANVTFTAQLLAINSDDVHIHGCGSGTVGQLDLNNASTAGSTYTASGLGASTDAIVVIRTGGRATSAAVRISGVTIDNLLLNMNSVGRRAIYLSSCWDCVLDHVAVSNLNSSDGGIYQEADAPGDTTFAASYFVKMDHIWVGVNSTNTTAHPFYFDASGGEIAYGTYTNLTAHGFQQAAGSGSDSLYVNTGTTSTNQSFDQNVFTNFKAQDPSTGSVYGIKLQCRGNFQAATNGRCFNDQFIDPQPERIFSTAGTGVAIGCVNGSGAADGTGCAFIQVQNLSSGGWANNEDVLNLGGGYMSNSDNSAVLQGPIFRQSGLHAASGVNGTTTFERVDPTFTTFANGQTAFSVLILPSTTNPGNFTGDNLQALSVDLSNDGTHTGGALGNVYGLLVNAFNCNNYATACWATYASGGGANSHFEGFAEIGTSNQSNPGGVANGGRFWYDQTNQRLELNNNNGANGTFGTTATYIPTLGQSDAWTGIENFPGNTAALTADWTCGTGGTVSTCAAATIIGSGGGVPLTFTLPLVARSYTLECDGVVGQATAATANQWNLLTATNGATNVTANYSMATAATASAYGAVTDQAATTTTFNIAPAWTLGGTGTKMPFHIWAKIEGASASGTVLSLQLLAPTPADLVTIFRGAACRVF